MSTTRNKRKRAENEVSTQGNRRRSGEVNTEAVAASKNDASATTEKNEINASSEVQGDSSTNTMVTSFFKKSDKTDTGEHSRGGAEPTSDSAEKDADVRGPLHSETMEPPNSSATNPDIDVRSSRIQAIVEHRRLLLRRIQISKDAANSRLSNEKGGEVNDETEIEEHLRMSRIASLAARKARGEENQTEKRTSLSLRRGSGVGKRMNAALSSLAPGTTGQASSPIPTQTISSSTGKTFLSKPNASSFKQVPSGPNNQPPAGSAPSQNVGGSSKSSKANQGIPRQSSVSQIRQGGSAKNGKSLSISTGGRTNNPGNGDQNRTRSLNSNTVFSEAIVLRQRRELVEAKLRTLLEQRSNYISPNLRQAPGRKSSRMLEIPVKVTYPKRRKTHWDRLLQEMNWLATDFIEERKWKMSARRTISSAIVDSDSMFSKKAKVRHPTRQSNSSKKAKISSELDLNILKKREKVSKEDDNLRTYAAPTIEDRKYAKNVSSLTSAMVKELVDAISNENTTLENHTSHLAAMARYKKLRADLVGSEDNQATDETASPIVNGEGKRDGNNRIDQDGVSASDSEITFSEISHRIQGLTVSADIKENISFDMFSSARTKGSFKLSEQQKTIVESVDHIWTNSRAGVFLSGMPMSGKTLASCSLIWKHRTQGAQLVVCPSSSVLRWRYELSLFDDINVINFGLIGGIGEGHQTTSEHNLQLGDRMVVLCEYAMFEKLSQQHACKFSTFFVDCRHPEGMFGSLGNDMQEPSSGIWKGPTEVISVEWWLLIITMSLQHKSKRLVIDYVDSDQYSLQRSFLSKREQLEIISLRAAFLLGSEIFTPSPFPLQRTVISWARHQKTNPQENKVDRVCRILNETLSPFSVRVCTPLTPLGSDFWDMRECEMTEHQRSVYNDCCCGMRGALAAFLDPNKNSDLYADSFSAAASALYQLRKICLSSTSPLLENQETRLEYGVAANKFFQPDAAMAQTLLENSGKFRELISILRDECGFSVDCDITTERLIPKRNQKFPRSKERQKVVILASLPRTQWLISLLLLSFGIRFKNLCNDATELCNDKQNISPVFRKDTWISNMEIQRSLLIFNGGKDAGHSFANLDCAEIVMVSPSKIATWHGGIGIDTASTVILMDEDWSGREAAALQSTMCRWNSWKLWNSVTTKAIRLISKTSIEGTIFNKEEAGIKNPTCEVPWPLNRSGVHILTLPMDQLLLSMESSYLQLPGAKILKLRDEALTDVLHSADNIVSFLQDDSFMRFLPKGKNASSSNDLTARMLNDLRLLRALYNFECAAYTGKGSVMNGSSHSPQNSICFESLQSFPAVASRSDISQISIQHLLKRQSKTNQHPFGEAKIINLGQLQDSSRMKLNELSLPRCNEVGYTSGILDDLCPIRKPEEKALDLISYGGKRDYSTKTGNRLNEYSNAFSSKWFPVSSVFDNSQGEEPITLFPPLLPNLQVKSAPPSKIQMPENMTNFDHVRGLVNLATEQKRKESVGYQEVNKHGSKRPRLDHISDAAVVGSSENMPVSGGEMVSSLNNKQEDDDFSKASPKVDEQDDYGLLGTGVVPLSSESMSALAAESVEIDGVDIPLQTQAEIIVDSNDVEDILRRERDERLGYVALFVKRYPKAQTSHVSSASTADLKRSQVGNINDLNVDELNKKTKKKASTQIASPTFSRLSTTGTTNTFNTGKEGTKHRLLNTYTSRQKTTGLSMFESTSFRVASIQIRKRVQARVDSGFSKALTRSEHGSGLPKLVPSQLQSNLNGENGIAHFTTCVQKLKSGAKTGDAAEALALAQYKSFRRSMVAPSKTDFGPFRSGFVHSSTGLAGFSSVRPRLGVSLPMGVKVNYNGQKESMFLWSPKEDKLLHATILRFGTNWIVVSKKMNASHDIFADEKVHTNSNENVFRSARQCRDRWHSLVRSDPNLSSDIRVSEKVLREYRHTGMPVPDSKVLNEAPSSSAHILITPFADCESPLDSSGQELPVSNEKSRASRLRSLLSKRETVSLKLPGIPPGGQPNQPVPSHPSHVQSVQSSIAAQWSNGRTELWPLQILDCADKHRSASRGSTQRPQQIISASSRSPVRTSQTNRPVSNNGNVSSYHRQQTSSISPKGGSNSTTSDATTTLKAASRK